MIAAELLQVPVTSRPVSSGTHAISLQKALTPSTDAVWHALTVPEQKERWLLNTDLQPEPGQELTFTLPNPAGWLGVVARQRRTAIP